MSVEVASTVFRGLSAWLLRGTHLSVVVTHVGGHIASISHNTDHINPLWQVR